MPTPAMNSWKLLRRLLLFEASPPAENPVFRRELARPPLWQHAARWMVRATGALLVSSGLVCYFSVMVMFYLKNLLILLLPVLGMWALLVIFTLAPVIAQERAQQTWDMLRAMPFELVDLLLHKTSGALWWLRALIRLQAGLLMVIAVGIGLASLLLSSASLDDNPLGLPPSIMCVSALFLPLVVASLFLMDRAQFFVLTILAALAASASTRHIRGAVSAALGITFAVWLFDLAVAALLLQFRASPTLGADLLSVSVLGPVAGYLGQFSPNALVLACAATVAVRELLVLGLWRWTLHAARWDV